MTIDKEKLRDLAGQSALEPKWYAAGSHGLKAVSHLHDREFIAAASPSTVLALLAEIERLEMVAFAINGAGAMELIAERDQLKAENEALRKDAERLSWLDESKEVDSVGPTLCCGKHRPDLREAIDVAMAMEASHG